MKYLRKLIREIIGKQIDIHNISENIADVVVETIKKHIDKCQ